MCGGTYIGFGIVMADGGLSPRVRGNPRPSCSLISTSRSIPACAGEPHPRLFSCSVARGLSPRVRGNLALQVAILLAGRSIPACAGEPSPSERKAGWERVYPRVCGGTNLLESATRSLPGLSPRVRGNLSAQNATKGGLSPRVRGTNLGTRGSDLAGGLSPRVRGNPTSVSACGRKTRSIPACAGEPPPASPSFPQNGVYPRVCGGTATDAS